MSTSPNKKKHNDHGHGHNTHKADKSDKILSAQTHSHKSPKHLIRLIVRKINEDGKLRIIRIARLFHRWKLIYSTEKLLSSASSASSLPTPPTPPAVSSSSPEVSFKEHRRQKLKTVIAMMCAGKYRNRIRYVFDTWLALSKFESYRDKKSHQMYEMKIGLQEVASSRSYIKSLENNVAQLKEALDINTFFFKWKSECAKKLLVDERIQWAAEKKNFLMELRRIRDVVRYANVQEAKLFESSIMCGSQLTEKVSDVHQSIKQMNMFKEKIEQMKGQKQSMPSKAKS